MPNGEPNEADIRDLREGEVVRDDKVRDDHAIVESSTNLAGNIAAGELDQAIVTAKRFPRSLSIFRREAMDMATIDEGVARECLFALKRGTKTIEGPSIRLAEIIACAWRNNRLGSRIIHEGRDMVIAEGIFYDTERNVQSQSQIARRIVDSEGRRYSLDMIVVTTNAAQAIAKRNAITSGVPRALWWDVYRAARTTAAGKIESLQTKRLKAIEEFKIYGIDPDQIFAKLGRQGIEEVSRDDLLVLFGILTAIKDEEITPENAFPRTVDIETLKGAAAATGNGTGKKDVSESTDKGVKEGTSEAMADPRVTGSIDAETGAVIPPEAEKPKPRAKRAPPPAME